jgi:type I restriction enzyme S subunit
MGHIQRHHLSDAKVVVPSRMSLDAIDRILSPIFRQLVQLRLESRTLATLRDTLLPQLLSGEMPVGAIGCRAEAET